MATEDIMLFQRDGDPDGDPVAHEGQEVGEDGAQRIAAGEGADGIDDDAEGVPDEAGHLGGVAAEDLEVDAGRVGGGDDVGDEAEGDDDGAEFSEAVQRAEAFDEQGALAAGLECGGVSHVCGYAGGQADAEDERVREGDAEAEQAETEDLPGGCRLGVVDEEVGCDSSVADGGAKAEREERKSR